MEFRKLLGADYPLGGAGRVMDATGANDTTELKGNVVLDARGVPEPGTICPTCGEKTPNQHALEMRRWRAKQKAKR